MRPSRSMVAAIRNVQSRLKNKGVKIDGEIHNHARDAG
jgi:hypothetical protein